MNHDTLLDRAARLRRFGAAFGLAAIAAGAPATTLTVTDTGGRPLATAKVREVAAVPKALDTSDNGYPAPGQVRRVDPEITRFTDGAGRVAFADRGAPVAYHVRKPGYRDASVSVGVGGADAAVALASTFNSPLSTIN